MQKTVYWKVGELLVAMVLWYFPSSHHGNPMDFIHFPQTHEESSEVSLTEVGVVWKRGIHISCCMCTVLCIASLDSGMYWSRELREFLEEFSPRDLKHMNTEPCDCLPLVNLKSGSWLEYQCEEDKATTGRRSICQSKNMGVSHRPSGCYRGSTELQGWREACYMFCMKVYLQQQEFGGFAKDLWSMCLFGTNAVHRTLQRPGMVSREHPSISWSNQHLNALHSAGPDIQLGSAKRELQAYLPNMKTSAICLLILSPLIPYVGEAWRDGEEIEQEEWRNGPSSLPTTGLGD